MFIAEFIHNFSSLAVYKNKQIAHTRSRKHTHTQSERGVQICLKTMHCDCFRRRAVFVRLLMQWFRVPTQRSRHLDDLHRHRDIQRKWNLYWRMAFGVIFEGRATARNDECRVVIAGNRLRRRHRATGSTPSTQQGLHECPRDYNGEGSDRQVPTRLHKTWWWHQPLQHPCKSNALLSGYYMLNDLCLLGLWLNECEKGSSFKTCWKILDYDKNKNSFVEISTWWMFIHINWLTSSGTAQHPDAVFVLRHRFTSQDSWLHHEGACKGICFQTVHQLRLMFRSLLLKK